MNLSFYIYNLRGSVEPTKCDDLKRYLQSLHQRFSNAIHAETRIYTCSAYRRHGSPPPFYDLHWNHHLPNETLIGTVGWGVNPIIVQAINAEFESGSAVCLCVFDSDAELRYQEMLSPA